METIECQPSLDPPQRRAVATGLLSTGTSGVPPLPTDSGKLQVAEQALSDTLKEGHRVIYLTPRWEQAQELGDKWAERFPGVPIGVFTEETLGMRRPPPVSFEEARLLIITPERLDACTRAWRSHWSWLPEVALLVVDELHLLGVPLRGARLEGALLRVRRLNPLLRVLALSAAVGNRAELADWLEGVEFWSEGLLLAPQGEGHAERSARAELEPVRSGLGEPRALEEQVIAELASGLCKTEEQLSRAFIGSLAHWQGSLPSVQSTLATMRTRGLLVEVADDKEERRPPLRATRLGRIAARHLVRPESVLQLAQATRREDADALTFFDLLLLALATDECELVLPADFEELEALSSSLLREPTLLLQGRHEEVVERFGGNPRRLLALVKTALVARAWTRSGDATQVAEAHGCHPFEVRRLTESLDRLLTALVAILSPHPSSDSEEPGEQQAPSPPRPPRHVAPLAERARALLSMVAYGLDEATVTLTFLPGLAGTLARRLQQAGIRDIETLATTKLWELAAVRGVSVRRARTWLALAEEFVPERSARQLRETGPTLAGIARPSKGDATVRRSSSRRKKREGSPEELDLFGLWLPPSENEPEGKRR